MYEILPPVCDGDVYSYNISLPDGITPPCTWELVAGDLPDGITLAFPQNGGLSGVANAPQGTYLFTMKVTDNGSDTFATVNCELYVSTAPVFVGTYPQDRYIGTPPEYVGILPDGVKTQEYYYKIPVVGSKGAPPLPPTEPPPDPIMPAVYSPFSVPYGTGFFSVCPDLKTSTFTLTSIVSPTKPKSLSVYGNYVFYGDEDDTKTKLYYFNLSNHQEAASSVDFPPDHEVYPSPPVMNNAGDTLFVLTSDATYTNFWVEILSFATGPLSFTTSISVATSLLSSPNPGRSMCVDNNDVLYVSRRNSTISVINPPYTTVDSSIFISGSRSLANIVYTGLTENKLAVMYSGTPGGVVFYNLTSSTYEVLSFGENVTTFHTNMLINQNNTRLIFPRNNKYVDAPFTSSSTIVSLAPNGFPANNSPYNFRLKNNEGVTHTQSTGIEGIEGSESYQFCDITSWSGTDISGNYAAYSSMPTDSWLIPSEPYPPNSEGGFIQEASLFEFAIVGGTLPNGLTLNTETGEIEGIIAPTGINFYFVDIQASVTSDPFCAAILHTVIILHDSPPTPPIDFDTYNVTLTVITGLDFLTASPLPNACKGSLYSQTLYGTGGEIPYSFALADGSSLPAGLSLNSLNSS